MGRGAGKRCERGQTWLPEANLEAKGKAQNNFSEANSRRGGKRLMGLRSPLE